MKTKTQKTRTGNINLGKLNDKPVYLTPTGLKIGPRGKVLGVSHAYSKLNKGEARKVRKMLHAAGYVPLAASKAIAEPAMMDC